MSANDAARDADNPNSETLPPPPDFAATLPPKSPGGDDGGTLSMTDGSQAHLSGKRARPAQRALHVAFELYDPLAEGQIIVPSRM